MSVSTLACAPSTIEPGATVRFKASGYSSADWTLQFVLNNGVDAPLKVTGDASGDGFTVTLSSADTAALKSGRYTWGEFYTATVGGEKTAGKTGTLSVLPSLLKTATPTAAQKMVSLLSGALEALAKTDRKSVNFNGQSFERAGIADYQKQLTYWESRVLREQAEAAALRGESGGGEIGVSFIVPGRINSR